MFEGLAGPMEDRKSEAIFNEARDKRLQGIEAARRQRLVELSKFFGMTHVIREIVDELKQVESGALVKSQRRFSDPKNATARSQLFAKQSDEVAKAATGGNLGLDGVEHPVRDGGSTQGLEATTMVEMAKDVRARLVLENPNWRGNMSDFDEKPKKAGP